MNRRVLSTRIVRNAEELDLIQLQENVKEVGIRQKLKVQSLEKIIITTRMLSQDLQGRREGTTVNGMRWAATLAD